MAVKQRPVDEVLKIIKWEELDKLCETFNDPPEIAAYFKLTEKELNRAIRTVKGVTSNEYCEYMRAKGMIALRQAQLRMAMGHTYEKTVLNPVVKVDEKGQKYVSKEPQTIKVYFPPNVRMLMWLGAEYLNQGKNLSIDKSGNPVPNQNQGPPILEVKINGQSINPNNLERRWTDKDEQDPGELIDETTKQD